MKFLALFWEMLEVKYGLWGELRRSWLRTWEFLGAIWVGLSILFGAAKKDYGRMIVRFWVWLAKRFGRRNRYKFSWWTYYRACNQTLFHARMAKSLWGQGTIDVDTCLAMYDRYDGIAKRALEQGYSKLGSRSIHDGHVIVRDWYNYANL
jgi:hypothetical protein